MKKPVPEDFDMTASEYQQAVQDLERQSKFFPYLNLTLQFFSLVLSLGVAIAVGLLATRISRTSGVGEEISGGLVILSGVFAFFGAALIFGWISDRIRQPKPIYRKVSLYQEALNRYRQTLEQNWMSIKGVGLEREVARLYKRLGYIVTQTRASFDEGIDLILHKDGTKIIVQCKGHDKPIGVGAIRDLYGVLMHSKAESAILVCTAGFTKGVKKFAFGKPIQLVSATELVKMAESVGEER